MVDRVRRAADSRDADDDVHVARLAPDLAPVFELHAGQDEALVVRHHVRHERRAALLQELVVDGLVDVAELVQIAPAERDADADLARSGRRHAARL